MKWENGLCFKMARMSMKMSACFTWNSDHQQQLQHTFFFFLFFLSIFLLAGNSLSDSESKSAELNLSTELIPFTELKPSYELIPSTELKPSIELWLNKLIPSTTELTGLLTC